MNEFIGIKGYKYELFLRYEEEKAPVKGKDIDIRRSQVKQQARGYF